MMHRLPPLNALRMFESAARHLSFKAAAMELHVTQAAVSHRIRSLEEYLGVELFERSGRGVRLTDAARACLPKLREGFDQIAAALEAIRLGKEDSELVVTSPPVFAARWLLPRLPDFAKREPRIELHVFISGKMVDGGNLETSAYVGDLKLDMHRRLSGVEIHLGAGDYAGYRVDRLFGVACTLVASPELVAGNPPLAVPGDLARHVLLHDDAMDLSVGGNAWAMWLEAAGVAAHVDASRGPRFSSNILSLEAAGQKLGIALALRPLIDADLAAGRLVAPFTVEVKPEVAYYLACPETIAERPGVTAFRNWLIEQAGAET
ncbi:MAG: LysR family transcriptional regulator [Betaproteobacteria bacterium]|nr:LysR family transcriptional regulator [Betaproteobacteria bacterium]